MPDGTLAELIVRLKAVGHEKVQEQADKTTKSVQRAGIETEKTSKRWGLAFKAAGMFSAAFFGLMAAAGPTTAMYLSQMWQSIGWLGDTLMAKTGAWKILEQIRKDIESIDKILRGMPKDADKTAESMKKIAEVPPPPTTIWDDLAKAMARLIEVAVLATIGVAAFKLATAIGLIHLLPYVLAIGGLVFALTLLDGWWKRNVDSMGLFAAAIDGGKKLITDLADAILTGQIPENFEIVWRESAVVTAEFISKTKKAYHSYMNWLNELTNTAFEAIKATIASKLQSAYEAVVATLERMKAALRATIAYFAANPVVRYITTIVRTVAAAIGRQAGGAVSAFQPYLVGERGPEMFVPAASGGITPAHALGGGFGGSIEIRNVIELDGRVIAESVNRVMADSLRRLGG